MGRTLFVKFHKKFSEIFSHFFAIPIDNGFSMCYNEHRI